jgi:hypothetical protein
LLSFQVLHYWLLVEARKHFLVLASQNRSIFFATLPSFDAAPVKPFDILIERACFVFYFDRQNYTRRTPTHQTTGGAIPHLSRWLGSAVKDIEEKKTESREITP